MRWKWQQVSEGKQKKGNVAAFFNKPGAVKTVAKKTEKVAEASVKKSTGAFLNDSDIDGEGVYLECSVCHSAPRCTINADVAKSSKIEALKPVPKRPDPKKVLSFVFICTLFAVEMAAGLRGQAKERQCGCLLQQARGCENCSQENRESG